ncbi:MAG: ATP-dependent DNA helicase RecG [Actinomycetota bacterium]|nr:ATP-dependent DNA helicase RecG [Actinomycetota bacterium]
MVGMSDDLTAALGPATAKPLTAAFGLQTVGDLLRHYPRRYAERGQLTPIGGLTIGEHVTVLAEVRKTNSRAMQRRKGTIQHVVISDGRSQLDLTFFNQRGLANRLPPGRQALFAGQVSTYRGTRQLLHPDFTLIDDDGDSGMVGDFTRPLIPVYPATKDVSSWTLQKCVRMVFDQLDGPDEDDDPLPAHLRREHTLPGLAVALRGIHRPDTHAEHVRARSRLKWDEALAVQVTLAQRRHAVLQRPAPACPARPGGIADAFDARLPFVLTAGQREVGKQLAAELAAEHPMNRLLQGEVGSGKTVVALRAMLQTIDSGRQAALLAPTEVLAAQHARSLRDLLGDLGRAGELGAADQATAITLLTGSLGAKARKQALLDAASGAAGIVVGTHALIQDRVGFADLGLVVVDEQHRFGVEQRDALRARGAGGATPHVLVMTATPIPRTIAMTVFGDLEVSSLRELPHGRSPIATSVVPMGEKPAWLDRAWRRITEEVAEGRQAFVVCPRIGDAEEEGDGEERRPPMAVLDVASQLADGPLHDVRLGVLHGRLPADEKDTVMRAFTACELDVLVATTVIEVGVDVPNATVMAILDADRFGISQLHQLRGRVGRGAHPGLCLLVTEVPPGSPSRARLDAVAATTDGFALATVDLELRREGDVLGAAQSGRRSGLKLLSLLADGDLIARARTEAQRLVDADPQLDRSPALAALVAALLDDDRAEFLAKA